MFYTSRGTRRHLQTCTCFAETSVWHQPSSVKSEPDILISDASMYCELAFLGTTMLSVFQSSADYATVDSAFAWADTRLCRKRGPIAILPAFPELGFDYGEPLHSAVWLIKAIIFINCSLATNEMTAWLTYYTSHKGFKVIAQRLWRAKGFERITVQSLFQHYLISLETRKLSVGIE